MIIGAHTIKKKRSRRKQSKDDHDENIIIAMDKSMIDDGRRP